MDVDQRTGVLTWCVTGPLQPRQGGYKDLGYYIAEGYEGLVRHTSCERWFSIMATMGPWSMPR